MREKTHGAARGRVLVVDDDEDIREVLTHILEARGYRVETAASGDEALALLRDRAAPSLILLDLRMPGMSGWEFCREQRRDPALADIPVLLLSGGSQIEHAAVAVGAADTLAKPVDLAELTEKVARHAKRDR